MTGTLVTPPVGTQMINLPTGKSPTDNVQKTDSFDSFMNRAQSDNAMSKTDEALSNKPVETEETVKDSGQDNVGVKNISKQEKTQDTVSEDDVSNVEEAIEKVKDVIEEKLNVSEEEISEVLSILGLNPLALLNTEQLPLIVAKLSEAEDTISLALDENLYESLSTISESVEKIVSDLSKELDIPVSEFIETVKEFEEVKSFEMPDIKTEEPVFRKKAEETVSVEDVQKKPFEEKVTISRFERSNTKTAALERTETVGTVEDTEAPKEDFTKSESFEGNSTKEDASLLSFAENLLTKVTEAFNEKTEAVTYSSFEVQNIMDQITESINVSISDETSEISLRLHPESLGSVGVKISADNEGVLTARFIASNESVKAIIESQAIVLREALESKGVTVEAVEVMVESHEFERNLSDNGKKSGNEEQPKKKGLRRIDLSEPLEEVSNDDSLVREMMAQNGNTIDYSA